MVEIVKINVVKITIYPVNLAVFKLKPLPISQNKWRIPLQK